MAIVQQFLVTNDRKGKEKVVATFNDKKDAAIYDKKVNSGYDLLDFILETAESNNHEEDSLEHELVKKIAKIDESTLEDLCLLMSLKGADVVDIIKGKKTK